MCRQCSGCPGYSDELNKVPVFQECTLCWGAFYVVVGPVEKMKRRSMNGVGDGTCGQGGQGRPFCSVTSLFPPKL